MADVSWKKEDIILLPARYKTIVHSLLNHPSLIRELSRNTTATELDRLTRVVIEICDAYPGRQTFLIRAFLQHEFEEGATQQTSILRGQSITSKVEAEYYLKDVLGDLILSIVTDSQLDLEIDPQRMKQFSEEARLYRIELVKQKVAEFAERIMHPTMLDKMPREIRAIAGFTAEMATRYTQAAVAPLIGGFIMLRYFSPGIVTPESFGILPPNVVLSYKARRNLIMIGKLLQNISNGISFAKSGKEEFMIVFDELIAQYSEKMTAYLRDVATDKLANGESVKPWGDLAGQPIAPNELKMDQVSVNELFILHRLLDAHKTKILPAFKKLDAELGEVLAGLGSPPSRQIRRDATPVTPSTDGPFLYMGPNNKNDLPVVYVILARLDITKFESLEALLRHIVKFVMDGIGKREYSMVIDMSWANGEDLTKSLFNGTSALSDMNHALSREDRKRVREIHLVHPAVLNRVVMFFLRSFTSNKFEKKVHEHANWRTLSEFITTPNISLPEQSKMFITKAYRVMKINAKGKGQERLLKFTLNSILNIDPKSSTLSNEKLITDISEIICPAGSDDIILKFTADSIKRDGGRKNALGLSKSTKGDLEQRKYQCKPGDRDLIVEDFFLTAFTAATIDGPLEYKIVKVNQAGKKQERTFKFTIDSVLNLDDNKIRTELSYAGFEYAKKDPANSRHVIMKMKNQANSRQLICKSPPECDAFTKRIVQEMSAYASSERRTESQLRSDAGNMYKRQDTSFI